MYWSRTDSPLDLLLTLLLTASWGLGGWLLARHAFHLRANERLPVGLAAGFVLFISLSGLLSTVLPVPWVFWVAALLVLAAGALTAWRYRVRPWLAIRDLRAWPILLGLLGVGLGFAAGLGIITVGGQQPWAWVTGIGVGILIATPFILAATVIGSYTMTAYHTCLYLWARDVERAQERGATGEVAAPGPLAAVLP